MRSRTSIASRRSGTRAERVRSTSRASPNPSARCRRQRRAACRRVHLLLGPEVGGRVVVGVVAEAEADFSHCDLDQRWTSNCLLTDNLELLPFDLTSG